MSDTPPSELMEELLNSLGEKVAGASLEHTLGDVSKDNPELVTELEQFEREGTVALMASLLTLPAHQPQCLRLELLVVLSLIHCTGTRVATVEDATRWYASIGDSNSVYGEDPAEDVFVSVVGNDRGDHFVLEGIWEAAGFYSQCLVDVVSAMPPTANYRPIKRKVQALLSLSNLICEQSTLRRFQDGGDANLVALDADGNDATILKTRVHFSAKELRAAGISIADLACFVLDESQIKVLPTATMGAASLEQRPLVRSKEGIVVALPTALTVALRHAVIRFAKSVGQLSMLDRALANAYSNVISDTPVFGGKGNLRLQWKNYNSTHFALAASQVDVGHFMILLFVLPSMALHTEAGFTDLLRIDGAASGFIHQAASSVAEDLTTREGFQRGLLVQVMCGWGAGFAGAIVRPNDERWQSEWMSGADFVRLGSLPEMSPLAFWRVQDAEATIHKAGVKILNFNGVLNLLGWMQANDGQLIPHDQLPGKRISPEAPLMLNLPTDMLRRVRLAADNGYDRHRVRDNLGRWHRVLRPSAEDYFPSERLLKSYASLDDLNNGVISGVHEGMSNLWVTLEAPNIGDRSMVYELWNMVRTWLGRIAGALEDTFDERVGGRSVKVYICFMDSADISRFRTAAEPGQLDQLWRLERAKEQQAIRIIFAKGFFAGFRAADNRAERVLVRALGSAFGALFHLRPSADVGNKVESLSVPNNNARSFHLMESNRFRDRVRGSLTQPLLSVEAVEFGAARIELGWRAVAADAPAVYEGKKATGALLNKVVDVLIADITANLAGFNRQDCLARLLENLERARTEEYQWHRTAAAVLGLHAGEPGTEAAIAVKMADLAGASLTSRLIMEMAICVCPLEGGIKPSDMALTRLLARAALLYRMGGLSDAIRYGALPAELNISPLGDILFRDDLGHMVLEPMLSKATNERFEAHAGQFEQHYAPPNAQPSQAASPSAAVDPRTQTFLEAWTSEMGFTFEEALGFVQGIEAIGILRNLAVFTLHRSELTAAGKSAGLDEKVTEAILGQFVLSTRPDWTTVPEGYKSGDIYPWRLGRRLSIAARPLLQFDTQADPIVLVAPGMLSQSLEYVFEGAYSGRLNRDFFRTEDMRDRWLGDAREGRSFELAVGEALTAAGWTVRIGVGFPEILGRSLDSDPGDIDVLAWHADSQAVLIVECKDLSLARNYSEVASQLSEYQGDVVDGNADKLRKHLNRVELARANAASFARFTSVPRPELVSWMVFSGVSPLHYAQIPALVGTHVGRIDDLRAFHG